VQPDLKAHCTSGRHAEAVMWAVSLAVIAITAMLILRRMRAAQKPTP
jgi:hypothetical protein